MVFMEKNSWNINDNRITKTIILFLVNFRFKNNKLVEKPKILNFNTFFKLINSNSCCCELPLSFFSSKISLIFNHFHTYLRKINICYKQILFTVNNGNEDDNYDNIKIKNELFKKKMKHCSIIFVGANQNLFASCQLLFYI